MVRLCIWQQKRTHGASFLSGGEGGIRTHGDREATVLFESTPIVHSGTSPDQLFNYVVNRTTSFAALFAQVAKKLLH